MVNFQHDDTHNRPHSSASWVRYGTCFVTSQSRPGFDIKMSSYENKKPHCGDKTIKDHLITTMRFPILVRWHLYIEAGPWSLIFHHCNNRADSRFAPSQWETSLQSDTVSHWLGANLESALIQYAISCCIGPSQLMQKRQLHQHWGCAIEVMPGLQCILWPFLSHPLKIITP